MDESWSTRPTTFLWLCCRCDVDPFIKILAFPQPFQECLRLIIFVKDLSAENGLALAFFKVMSISTTADLLTEELGICQGSTRQSKSRAVENNDWLTASVQPRGIFRGGECSLVNRFKRALMLSDRERGRQFYARNNIKAWMPAKLNIFKVHIHHTVARSLFNFCRVVSLPGCYYHKTITSAKW